MRIRHTIETVNERLMGRGIVCLSYSGSIMRKSIFRCEKGHEWQIRADAIFSGNGCPHCSNRAKLSIAQINERLSDRAISCINYGGSVMKESTFVCNFGHQWKTTADSVMRSSSCPFCSNRVKLSVEEINRRLQPRGLSCTEYNGSSQRLSKFTCGNGHSWEATSDNVCNKGTGCPFCCEFGGFNPSLPGYVYFLYSREAGLLKVGITNVPNRRMSQLKRATPFPFEIVGMIQVENARKVEKEYHLKFENARLVGFDGCSEWFKFNFSGE